MPDIIEWVTPETPAKPKEKILPELFTFIYFGDVATSLVALLIWSDWDINYTNPLLTGFINNILLWIMFKVLSYMLIVGVMGYIQRKSPLAENIMISITVIYAIFAINHLASLTMVYPMSHIDPSFYQAIEAGKLEIIP